MTNYDDIIQRLVVNEGCSLTPYKCPAGYLTIGVGRNLETNPLTAEEKLVCGDDYLKGITKNAAYFLLRNDIEKVRKDLDKNLPWWINLNDDRRFVMIDLCFQMGIKGLLKFNNTLRYLSTGFYKQAASNLRESLYYKQVKNRAERNARCIETGKYTYD